MILESARQMILLLKTIESNVKLSPGCGIVELATLPAIVLEGPKLSELKKRRHDKHWFYASDIPSAQYVSGKGPRHFDMSFSVTVAARREMELLELCESLSRLVMSHALLEVPNGSLYQWDWSKPLSGSGKPNISSVHEAQGEILIQGVELLSHITEMGALITKIDVDVDSGRDSELVTVGEGIELTSDPERRA